MAFTSLRNPRPIEPEEKYRALRAVLLIWKAFVMLLVIVVVTFAVYWVLAAGKEDEPAQAILFVVGGLVAALIEWAAIQVIEVLLDIEANTRRGAERE